MAKFDTLHDDFNDGSIDGSKWAQNGAGTTESGGALNIPKALNASTNIGLQSINTYDLEDSYAQVKVVDRGTQLSNWQLLPLGLFQGSDLLTWQIIDSTIYAFAPSEIYSAAYSSTTHKWLRIRETSGTIHFEYSTSGLSWSTAATTTTSFDISAMTVVMEGNTTSPTSDAATLRLDNFNVLIGAINAQADSTATAIAVVTHFLSATALGDSSATARASNFSQPQEIDRKTYLYKVYDTEDNFLGLWNDVVSELTYSQEINSAGSSIEVQLARNSDTLFTGLFEIATEAGVTITTEDDNPLVAVTQSGNQIGPDSTVDLNLRVDIYVFYGREGILGTEDGEDLLTEESVEILATVGSPNGRRIFTGYISRYVSRYGSSETTQVSLLSFGDELDNYVIEDAGDTTVPYLSQDPSDILRDVLDKYTSAGGIVSYAGSTISNTSTTVTYTFKVNTTLEGIKKSLELAPSDWFWYLDMGQNLIYFQPRPAIAQHTFILGKHIENLNLEKYIEDITNVIYFTGGDTGGGENLFKKYVDTASITANRRGLQRISDNRVTLESSADIISESELDRNSEPRYRSSITILDKVYDIESISLGDVVQFRNFGNYVDSLLLQVVSINYQPDKIGLQLDTLLPSVNKRVADIRRNLDSVNTLENPDTPI